MFARRSQRHLSPDLRSVRVVARNDPSDLDLFHSDSEAVRPSIVDSYGFYLAGAAAKLKGLADYALAHGDVCNRIDVVAEVDGKLFALDLKSTVVRAAVGSTRPR